MGLFGPSKKEKFAVANARGLAEYVKDNAVKLGGEAYAKAQTVGTLARDIDKPTLWYFWSCVFAYRAAKDTLSVKADIGGPAAQALLQNLADVDNDTLGTLDRGGYPETFASVNIAIEMVKAMPKMTDYEQASMFMLHAVKSIPGLDDQDKRFTVVQLLTQAALGFPPVPNVIEQNA
jgi:hypothetical protein